MKSSDEEMPILSDDEDSSDWDEMEKIVSDYKCFFCNSKYTSDELALDHMEKDHQFNLSSLKSKFNMDYYSYIKMVNYIKKNKINSTQLNSTSTILWDNNCYFKPVEENDPWLMYDFDSVLNDINIRSEIVPFKKDQLALIGTTVESLKLELDVKETILNLAIEDIKKMKDSTRALFTEESDSVYNSKALAPETKRCVSNLDLDDDVGYFSSYAHYGIHHEMLNDKVRTESYRTAILNNPSVFCNAKVIDVGCGTGILSMFSATVGAAKVIAVDQSDVIYQAMDIIRENGLLDIITPLKGRLEDLEIPDDKVDIIISEWMGYFLLFEGMLDSIIYARDRHLKPGGILLPNRCNISIVGSGDTHTHNNIIGFWTNVYGFKMTCMQSEVIKEATIEITNKDYIITTSSVLVDIDIYTCNTDCVNFSSDFTLTVTKDGFLTSLVGYFDTFFELPNPVQFSTGPDSEPTHWKQTVFYFKNTKAVKKDEIIKGSFYCSRDVKNIRGLTIIIQIFGETYKYLIS